MIKQLGLVAGAVAIGCLTAGSVPAAVGSSDGDRDDDRRVLRVIAVNDEENFVDNPPRREDSLGDMFVFSANLSRHGDKVGRAGVVCTLTSTDGEESLCEGNAAFRRGQIAIQGLILGEELRFPIVGGTGRFNGAGGELLVEDLSGNRERWTFHLTF